LLRWKEGNAARDNAPPLSAAVDHRRGERRVLIAANIAKLPELLGKR
jgi:hypothetical protein